MAKHLPLLIIGAGPYGLAMASYARHKNIEHVVVGKMMEFWKSNMPKGMYLRSACDWHYDPFNEATIERYIETKNLKPADVEPLALDFYLSYVEWFVKQQGIEILAAWVQQLNYVHDAQPFFEAVLQDGTTLTARNVVLALGFRYFKNVEQIPLLTSGNIAARLETKNGFPVLDEHLQSNMPGLFFTSMCATQDFGPFFAFTAGIRTSAKLVGSTLGA